MRGHLSGIDSINLHSYSVSMAVLQTLNRFVDAFERLDIDEMMSCFAEEASSFFPVNHYPTYIQGKDEIRDRFEEVLVKIQGAGLTRMELPVRDLEIADYGDTALATFQIFDNDISRRTLLLKNTGEEWRIVHLHASNAPLEEL